MNISRSSVVKMNDRDNPRPGRFRFGVLASLLALTLMGCGSPRPIKYYQVTYPTKSSVAEDAGAVRLLRELADARPGEPSGEPSSNSYQLTSREKQILRLVWKGSSNKSIARDLFLTENTVETHLRRIYQKLGTRKRTQAAALAREAGAI